MIEYDDETQERFKLSDSEVEAANNNESSPWYDHYLELANGS